MSSRGITAENYVVENRKLRARVARLERSKLASCVRRLEHENAVLREVLDNVQTIKDEAISTVIALALARIEQIVPEAPRRPAEKAE